MSSITLYDNELCTNASRLTRHTGTRVQLYVYECCALQPYLTGSVCDIGR